MQAHLQGIRTRAVRDGDDYVINGSLNAKKIPKLFVDAVTTRSSDHKIFPWTMG